MADLKLAKICPQYCVQWYITEITIKSCQQITDKIDGISFFLTAAMYKCHGMGLLPTHSSDWLAFADPIARAEFSLGTRQPSIEAKWRDSFFLKQLGRKSTKSILFVNHMSSPPLPPPCRK
jgi:hypothetical protein